MIENNDPYIIEKEVKTSDGTIKVAYEDENGSQVLKNKLNITNAKELSQAMRDIGFVKLMSLDDIMYDKNYGSDLIKNCHRHIFGDVFIWAGEYRKVPIYHIEDIIIPGLSLDYCMPEKIESRVNEKFNDINNEEWNKCDTNDFIKKMVKHFSEIWAIHPFRDGNTRTTFSAMYLFAKDHNLYIDFGKLLENYSRKHDEKNNITGLSMRDYLLLAVLDEPKSLENELNRITTNLNLTTEREKISDKERDINDD